MGNNRQYKQSSKNQMQHSSATTGAKNDPTTLKAVKADQKELGMQQMPETSEQTRTLREIYFAQGTEVYKKIEDSTRKTEIEKRIEAACDSFDALEKTIEEYFKQYAWEKIEGEDAYLHRTGLVVPDVRKRTCSTYSSYAPMPSLASKDLAFGRYQGCVPNRTEADMIKEFFNLDSIVSQSGENFSWKQKGGHWNSFNSLSQYYNINLVPVVHLETDKQDTSILKLLIDNDIKLEIIANNDIYNKVFESMKSYYYAGQLFISELGNNVVYTFSNEIYQKCYSGEIKEINGVQIDAPIQIDNTEIEADDRIIAAIKEKLLSCDFDRANIAQYDPKRLTDPNMGHWELWNQSQDSIRVKLTESLVARNPIVDIRENGLIGIDFGTKSTVVVCQDGDERITPMRVGTGEFHKKAEAKHYENPTVMEFRDLKRFITAYRAREGRPETKWEDMAVSHTAFNDLSTAKSDDYYTFFNDLKQWAGDKNARFRIKDHTGYEYDLKSYLTLTDADLDPIEYYAYYIGLYINNMHNGIYIDYLLSFPVTYEKAVREKILNSFSRGLKKALPVEVLHNEDIMKRFRVVQGASEPAAYAICALEQYGFDPDEGEEIFYGIFDFGGGTTDFDFGIWRSANEDEDRYDYVINHFGSGGDKYLGGENLLSLLAYQIFVENQDALRADNIVFQKPEECKAFPGSEVLLNESQEAKLNMKQLIEKLRPLWERQDGYEEKYKNGEIQLTLFDSAGETKINYPLKVNIDALEKILYDRIEQGVKNFFAALQQTFLHKRELVNNTKEIHIFLAGNSSKSPIVKELFDKYIAKHTDEIHTLDQNDGNTYYHVYPALGTSEAVEIQKQRKIDVDEADMTRPTGKTGVAFGLIEGRSGGPIKVISESGNATDEIKFAYYVGRNRKKKFKTVLSRETAYQTWVKFISAEAADFELYVSDLPEAELGELPINQARKIKCMTDTAVPGAFVYIRAVAPTVLEYVVATEHGIANGQYLGEVIRKELQE